MSEFILNEVAAEDLADLVGYLTAESEEAGARLFKAAIETFAYLAQNPRVGSFFLRGRRTRSLRCWTITGFKRYRVFYRESKREVEILRVLHASRDIDRIWRDEPM